MDGEDDGIAEVAKSIVLIREKTLSKFNVTWNPLLTFSVKQIKIFKKRFKK